MLVPTHFLVHVKIHPFRIVCYIMGVSFSGVSVKRGSTLVSCFTHAGSIGGGNESC